VRSLVVVAGLALLLIPGCSASTCTYGTGNNGFCKGRGRPSAHESSGWHTASLKPRVADARAEAGSRIIQANVTQYGELWLYTGDTDHVVIDVDGHRIDPKEEDSATGDAPFPSKIVTAAAIDHAMEYIRPRARDFDFIAGKLYVGDFGHDKGLWWHIQVYSPERKQVREFLAEPNGQVKCEHLIDGVGTNYARISGEGCPDQGF
jgi:hypothetical protein